MIKFGTGGWRDIIGENFTFDNVRRFSQGVAKKIIQEGKEKQGVVIGFDNRFMAEEFAQASAEVFAGNDIQVYLLDRKSTRLNSSHVAISYAVFCLKKK